MLQYFVLSIKQGVFQMSKKHKKKKKQELPIMPRLPDTAINQLGRGGRHRDKSKYRRREKHSQRDTEN